MSSKNCFLFLLACATATAVMRAENPDYEHSLGIGFFDLLHVKVSATATSAAFPSTASLTNRSYLDGYNNVDSSNDLGEGAPGLATRTGFWGYTSNSQVNLSAGTIAFHDLLPPSGPYMSDPNASGRPSLELIYKVVRVKPGSLRIGLELRAAYVDLEHSASASGSVPLTLVTDTYQLGGVVPPQAPYSGTYTVVPFTPRIGDTPTRTSGTVQGSALGTTKITAKGCLIRLGLVWRPIETERLDVELHGGPALLALSGSFASSESFSTGSIPPLSLSSSGSGSKSLSALYVGGTGRYAFNEHWGVTGAIDFLDAGTFHMRSASVSTSVDFSQAILLHLGLSRRFEA